MTEVFECTDEISLIVVSVHKDYHREKGFISLKKWEISKFPGKENKQVPFPCRRGNKLASTTRIFFGYILYFVSFSIHVLK